MYCVDLKHGNTSCFHMHVGHYKENVKSVVFGRPPWQCIAGSVGWEKRRDGVGSGVDSGVDSGVVGGGAAWISEQRGRSPTDVSPPPAPT